MQAPRFFKYTALSFIAGKPAPTGSVLLLNEVKKKGLGKNPQALKR
jgi:hypothetical protein